VKHKNCRVSASQAKSASALLLYNIIHNIMLSSAHCKSLQNSSTPHTNTITAKYTFGIHGRKTRIIDGVAVIILIRIPLRKPLSSAMKPEK